MEVNNTSVFNNKLTVNTGGLQTSSLTVTGNTTLNNTLSVDKATTLKSTLSVTSATTLNSTLYVSEPTTLHSRLDVDGDVSLNSNTTIKDLQVSGSIGLNNLTTSGNAIIGGSLTVPNDNINLANKLRIDNTNNITTIQDDAISILNSGTRTRFIEIVDNKLTINGLSATDEVMDVTGVITASNVTLKAGGTVTSSGDTSTSSSSIVIGDTSNGLGIYPKDGTGTAGDPFSGIAFNPFIDESRVNENEPIFSIDNSGNTIIDGTLTVNNGTTIDSSFNVTGYSSLNNLITTGDTSLNNLNVINASTLSSTLNVNGATTLSSTLNVTGLSTLSNVTVSSNLNVSNATTLSSSLDVSGSSTFNDTLTVSKKTSLNSDVDISGNASVSHGPFTVNDVSFNVTSLPTSITGNFTNNQKTLYSTHSGSDRVFNGLYDVSASSVFDDNDSNEPWHVFDGGTTFGWVPGDGNDTAPGSRVSYIDNTSSVVDVSCEYIQITFPFYLKLNRYVIQTGNVNTDVTLIASDNDDSFYELTTIDTNNNTDTVIENVPHTFYSNKFKFVFPAQSDSINILRLFFDGDVLGSQIHVDNGNLGVGTTIPRSALEVTGDMIISKPINGENTSGSSVEHGRIVWAGIGRDVSNNNHSSYIRSYFENDTYDTSGNLAFGTSNGVNSASDKFVINANGINNFITDVSMDSNLAVNGDVSFNNNLYVKEKVWIDGTVGIGTANPGVVFDISDTGALRIPVGENSTRPIDVTGATSDTSYYGSIRYNTQGSKFEGYGPGGTWKTLSGLSNASDVTRIDPDVNNKLIFYTAEAEATDINASQERMVIQNTADISMNTSLSVAGNCNFNSNVDISGDLVINGNLSVYQTNDTTTIHTTVNDYALIVSEDISLNGELKMSGAAILNNTLNVTGSTVLNNTLNVASATTIQNTLNVTGATTLQNTLRVTGSTILSNSLNVTGATTVSSTLNVTGAVSGLSFDSGSDYRIKENVVSISDTSYNIDKLRPVTYTNILLKKQDFGVIAHELQEQLPFLVTGEKDGEKQQSVNYNGLIGLLLNEVQQLKKRVQELEQSKP